MSGRDDRVSLVDMLNHAEEAVVLLGEASLNDLAEDRVMELALRNCWRLWVKRPAAFPRRHNSVTKKFPGPRLLECVTD